MGKIDQEIEKLVYAVFGRVERDIEIIALRYGIPKGEFADRVSALLSAAPSRTVLGMSDRMPTMPQETGPDESPSMEPLALGEFSPSHRVHHERRNNPRQKGHGKRPLTVALLPTLQWPMEQRVLRRILQEKIGLVKGSVDRTMQWCVEKGHLHREGSIFSLSQPGQQSGNAKPRQLMLNVIQELGGTFRQDNLYRTLRARFPEVRSYAWNDIGLALKRSGALKNAGDRQWTLVLKAGPKIEEKKVKKPPTLPKGEPTRIVMKFMKNKQLTQKDACHRLVKKYPDTVSMVWNGVLTNSVRIGLLRKLADGTLEIAGGKNAANSVSKHV